MDLTSLNKKSIVDKKEVKKLHELPKDSRMRIYEAKVVKTSFGEAILLDLGYCVTFLPQRVTEAYRPHIEEFEKTRTYSLVFRGQVEIGKTKPVNSFEIVEDQD